MLEPLTRVLQRKRLDSLSSFRMNLGAVRFSSSTSHRGGGKARVVQATVRGKAGNEEIVAVKKLNFPEGMEIHKFSNVRKPGFSPDTQRLLF